MFGTYFRNRTVNGVVVRDVELEQLSGSRQLTGLEVLECCVAFGLGARRNEDMVLCLCEELGSELKAYAAVGCVWGRLARKWGTSYERIILPPVMRTIVLLAMVCLFGKKMRCYGCS